MYLTTIDKKEGFVDITDIQDGVMAIKEFKDIIEDKKLGIACFTAIALTVDYLSPLRHYGSDDRARAAQEEVTGKRDAFPWKSPKIQEALKKYDMLQFNPDIEEGRIHNEQRIRKMRQISEYDSWTEEDKKKISMVQLKKDLRNINSDLEDYQKRISGKEIYSESPVVNGYSLSRLEIKQKKKNSFYHEVR